MQNSCPPIEAVTVMTFDGHCHVQLLCGHRKVCTISSRCRFGFSRIVLSRTGLRRINFSLWPCCSQKCMCRHAHAAMACRWPCKDIKQILCHTQNMCEVLLSAPGWLQPVSLSACQPVVHVLCHISGLLQLPCDQQIETDDAVTATIVLIALTCFSSAKCHTLNSSDMLWACSMLQPTLSWQALGFRTSEMPNVAHNLLLIMESRNS